MLSKDEKVRTLEAIQYLSDAARHLAEMYREATVAHLPGEKWKPEDVVQTLKTCHAMVRMANRNIDSISKRFTYSE